MKIRSYGRAALIGTVLAVGCTHLNVSAEAVNADGLKDLRTFSVLAPTPPVASGVAASFNGSGRGSAVVMDMNPMLSTSLVGRAIRQDLEEAFGDRGYSLTATSPDFYVAYYAGTGEELDIRARQYSYHVDGERTDVRTTRYPAGTLIVDVVSARTHSVLWRGTAIAEIPTDPEDYARTIRTAVGKVVSKFPRT